MITQTSKAFASYLLIVLAVACSSQKVDLRNRNTSNTSSEPNTGDSETFPKLPAVEVTGKENGDGSMTAQLGSDSGSFQLVSLADGAQILFPPNSCDGCKIDVSIVEVDKLSDMVKSQAGNIIYAYYVKTSAELKTPPTFAWEVPDGIVQEDLQFWWSESDPPTFAKGLTIDAGSLTKADAPSALRLTDRDSPGRSGSTCESNCRTERGVTFGLSLNSNSRPQMTVSVCYGATGCCKSACTWKKKIPPRPTHYPWGNRPPDLWYFDSLVQQDGSNCKEGFMCPAGEAACGDGPDARFNNVQMPYPATTACVPKQRCCESNDAVNPTYTWVSGTCPINSREMDDVTSQSACQSLEDLDGCCFRKRGRDREAFGEPSTKALCTPPAEFREFGPDFRNFRDCSVEKKSGICCESKRKPFYNIWMPNRYRCDEGHEITTIETEAECNNNNKHKGLCCKPRSAEGPLSWLEFTDKPNYCPDDQEEVAQHKTKKECVDANGVCCQQNSPPHSANWKAKDGGCSPGETLLASIKTPEACYAETKGCCRHKTDPNLVSWGTEPACFVFDTEKTSYTWTAGKNPDDFAQCKPPEPTSPPDVNDPGPMGCCQYIESNQTVKIVMSQNQCNSIPGVFSADPKECQTPTTPGPVDDPDHDTPPPQNEAPANEAPSDANNGPNGQTQPPPANDDTPTEPPAGLPPPDSNNGQNDTPIQPPPAGPEEPNQQSQNCPCGNDCCDTSGNSDKACFFNERTQSHQCHFINCSAIPSTTPGFETPRPITCANGQPGAQGWYPALVRCCRIDAIGCGLEEMPNELPGAPMAAKCLYPETPTEPTNAGSEPPSNDSNGSSNPAPDDSPLPDPTFDAPVDTAPVKSDTTMTTMPSITIE